MQCEPLTPRKRIFLTPKGMAELDIAGTERRIFVTITVFDDEGWAINEDMWWSGHGEGLAVRVVGLTGMSPSEADVVVDDFLSTWKDSGGPAEGAVLTHRFGYGLIGTLLAVAGFAGVVTSVIGRRVHG